MPRPRLRSALLVAGLLATSGLAGCSSPADRSAPSLADVRSVLARHGAAVLHHDREAFAADLDTADRASAFRAGQLGEYANLIRLPLRTWQYRLVSRTDFREAERNATRIFGTDAVIVHVTLRFALAGVDRIPTSHDLWWTFVRHDGHVVIAADGGLASAGGASWKGPWDFGRLTVLRGPHSLVLGHPDSAAALRAIQATVEAAVPAVSAVWGTDWTQDVAVVVPSSAQELTEQTGRSSDVTVEIAAVAISDGQDPLSGTVYGQRLIVNPDALARLSGIGRRIVIRHEITHIASAAATTQASPQWLIEGFADYVGNLGTGQPAATVAAELRADVRRGRLPRTLPSPNSFTTAGQSAQAYEGSWLACRLIAQRAGQDGLVRFYHLVGDSAQEPDAAVGAALRSLLHESTAQFTAQWRAYVRAQLT